jgi:Outer membrane lipoprotein carrier protein LolA-like
LALALLAAPATHGQAVPPSPEPPPSLDIGALMARLAAVPERRARFQEEKRLAALTEPLRSAGRLRYRRPDRMEKVTEWPEPESLVVDGDRLVVTEGQEPPRVVDLSAHPEARAAVDALRGPLSGDLTALRRSFAVTASGTPAAWRLVLVPADPAAARLLARVEVEGTGDTPRAVTIRQADGDEDRLLIEPSP